RGPARDAHHGARPEPRRRRDARARGRGGRRAVLRLRRGQQGDRDRHRLGRRLHVGAAHRARGAAAGPRGEAQDEQLMAFTLAAAAAVAATLLAGSPSSRARGRGAVEAPATPAVEFERGKNAFARGEYGRAVELLRPLVYPEVRLETEGEIVQAHRMLGV